MRYVGGIDLGTQSCKAVVCDEQLAVVGSHAVPVATRFPPPGWAQQDPRARAAALGAADAGAQNGARAGAGARAAQPVCDRTPPSPMVETHAYPTGAFFVENPGWLSGGAVRWATRT